MEGLLTLLLSDKLGLEVSAAREREPNPLADQLRAQIRESLKESRQGTPGPAPAGSSPEREASLATDRCVSNSVDTVIGDAGPASSPQRREAFLREGPRMVEWLPGMLQHLN